MTIQKTVTLSPYPKGFHLITRRVEGAAGKMPDTGMMHVLIQHTSAGITLNENADPSVRHDFESFISHLVPENHPLYSHVSEGADDMPAHLKASLIGSSVTIPITNGRLNLGIWQGIYLCEFRNNGGSRTLVITITS
jgi:secondary thiamine-phosphate synthase enzyme